MSGQNRREFERSGGSGGEPDQKKAKLERIIVDGDAKTLVEVARTDVAKKIVNISTSQIRNIYGTAKKIEMRLSKENTSESYKKLILLKPKMEYAKGRARKRAEKAAFSVLVDYLSKSIDLAEGQEQRMKNFFNFFEAILAYHRAEGGK